MNDLTKSSRRYDGRKWRRGAARPLADLIGGSLNGVCRKRGFATVDLLCDWPDIVGERYGERVMPDKLVWGRPREVNGETIAEPATLVVHTDGATALILSHELPQLIERINAFFGWAAVGRIRIVQKPVTVKKRPELKKSAVLSDDEQAKLQQRLKNVTNPKLHAALARLGAEVIGKNRSSSDAP